MILAFVTIGNESVWTVQMLCFIIVTDVRLVQPSKALKPITVTAFGITMDVKASQA